MAIPLIVPLGAAAIAAYLLLSGKSSAAAPAPGGGGGGPSPYYGGTPSAPPASGGGQTYGTSPGQIDPNTGMTILGPGGTSGDGGLLGNAVGSDGSGGVDPSAMNAAVATGTAAGVVGASGAGGYCTLPDGSVGFWSEHPNVLDATGGRGGWVPAYPGHEHGYAPPGNLPIY